MEKYGDLFLCFCRLVNTKSNSKRRRMTSETKGKVMDWNNRWFFSTELKARDASVIINFVHRAFFVAKCYLISKEIKLDLQISIYRWSIQHERKGWENVINLRNSTQCNWKESKDWVDEGASWAHKSRTYHSEKRQLRRFIWESPYKN